jgi:hypothetical protein
VGSIFVEKKHAEKLGQNNLAMRRKGENAMQQKMATRRHIKGQKASRHDTDTTPRRYIDTASVHVVGTKIRECQEQLWVNIGQKFPTSMLSEN